MAKVKFEGYYRGVPQKITLDDAMAEMLRVTLDLVAFYPVLRADKAQRLFPNSAYYMYKKGEVVVAQGDASQDIYIVHAGAVRVTQKLGASVNLLATLGPGAMFGEMALLRKGERSATVTADAPSRIYRLSIADVERIMAMDDKLSQHLTELAEKRLLGG